MLQRMAWSSLSGRSKTNRQRIPRCQISTGVSPAPSPAMDQPRPWPFDNPQVWSPYSGQVPRAAAGVADGFPENRSCMLRMSAVLGGYAATRPLRTDNTVPLRLHPYYGFVACSSSVTRWALFSASRRPQSSTNTVNAGRKVSVTIAAPSRPNSTMAPTPR